MVDGSACEVIGTGTVKVTKKDEMVRALEAVQYVLVYHRGTVQSNIHKSARRKRLPNPSATRRRHS